MSQILFTDASIWPPGSAHLGVVNAAGGLLVYRDVDCPDAAYAELLAVRLACDHMTAGSGVILTDSIGAPRGIAGRVWERKLRAPAYRYAMLYKDIAEHLPTGWRVCWVPRGLNLADAPIRAQMRTDAGRPGIRSLEGS